MRTGTSRLLVRFTVSALVAFLLIGSALAFVLSRQIRGRQEADASFHAQFVTKSILAYGVTAKDLRGPMKVDGKRYAELDAFVHERVLHFPALRVKIWSSNGTVLFSDEPRLVGKRFAFDEDLRDAFNGHVHAGVSDLTQPENVFDRSLAKKLYEAYVPLRLPAGVTGAPVVAVAELYQDYADIQAETNLQFRRIFFMILAGLVTLYVLLLPIIIPVARTLGRQNARLEEDARRSEELLHREHATVAELRKLNRLQREFVAVASHELRTPLTSIIGYAKTLRQPQFADDGKARAEFVQAIERQADRLLGLVENLLTSSHLEEQPTKLSVSTFAFPEVVREVVEGLGVRRDRIKLELQTDLPSVLSDRQYVSQILANLVGNALKFSPNGTPVYVGARWEGGSLSFWVRDQGIGIPAGEIDKIFDRFYQVDSSSTRAFGGIGLGLSLVKNMVQSLGGTIQVTSQHEAGSTFTVRVPLVHPSIGDRYGHTGNLDPDAAGTPKQPTPVGR
jgi:signal transduction histidine kinase